MSRLCPVCESDQTGAGFNGKTTGDKGREDHATASCHVCGSLWDEVFYRRTGETVNSNIRPGALKAAENLTYREPNTHSQNEGYGCPLCGAIHIGVKPHGPLAAECLCIDCGATWSHRFEHGNVYRSNIKALVKQ
jgi:hypothetical protein